MQTILKFNFDFSLYKQSYFVFFVIFLRLIPVTADFSYFIVAGYALLGRRQVIVSLFLMWLFSMLNTEIIPYAKYESFSRYLVVFACLSSLLLRANFKNIDNFVLVTFLLGFFLIIHSILFSNFLLVSILKATYWTLIITTLLIAWQGMSKFEHEYTTKWILDFLFISIMISFILYLVYPNIGFIRNSTYFHGIFNHPQVMGLTSAGVSALLISQIDFKKKLKLFLLIKIIISILLLLLSGSRTAAIALFLSIPISGLLIIYKHNIIKLTTKFQFHKSYVILVLTLTFFILLFESKIFNFIEIYLNKTNLIGSGDFVSAYQDSRAVLYEPMINNILQNFFKGIGFGLASDLSNMNVRYFFGIPVSAPIEKGILPLSILEEIGIYGFIFFMIWILIIIGQGIKKDYGSLNIILTFLLFNLGEAGFFSPNGFGMLYLIVITSIITKPKFTKSIN